MVLRTSHERLPRRHPCSNNEAPRHAPQPLLAVHQHFRFRLHPTRPRCLLLLLDYTRVLLDVLLCDDPTEVELLA